MNLRDVLSLNL